MKDASEGEKNKGKKKETSNPACVIPKGSTKRRETSYEKFFCPFRSQKEKASAN